MEQKALETFALSAGAAGVATGPMVGVADFWLPLVLGIFGAAFATSAGLSPKARLLVPGIALLLSAVAIAFGIIAYTDFTDAREAVLKQLESI